MSFRRREVQVKFHLTCRIIPDIDSRVHISQDYNFGTKDGLVCGANEDGGGDNCDDFDSDSDFGDDFDDEVVNGGDSQEDDVVKSAEGNDGHGEYEISDVTGKTSFRASNITCRRHHLAGSIDWSSLLLCH